MTNSGIRVHFKYESYPNITLKFNSNKKINEVCRQFAKEKNINFNTVFFILNGTKLENGDFDQPLYNFVPGINKDSLHILVYDYQKSEVFNLNENFNAVFYFKSSSIKIQCFLRSKILDASKAFTSKICKDINSLNFKYNGQKINLYKTFNEIVNQYDKNRRQIDIIVEENYISKISNNTIKKASSFNTEVSSGEKCCSCNSCKGSCCFNTEESCCEQCCSCNTCKGTCCKPRCETNCDCESCCRSSCNPKYGEECEGGCDSSSDVCCKVFLVLLIIAIVAAIGVGLYFLIKHLKKN